jgi:Protein of unknown function (DUF3039)
MPTPLIVMPVVETPAPVETPRVSNNDGDHERFAHYVAASSKHPMASKRDAAAIVTEARVMGTPVKALCGKEWVPSRDPQNFPVCPTCAEMAKGLRGGA